MTGDAIELGSTAFIGNGRRRFLFISSTLIFPFLLFLPDLLADDEDVPNKLGEGIG